jgi:multiple sugar transport system permease protein
VDYGGISQYSGDCLFEVFVEGRSVMGTTGGTSTLIIPASASRTLAGSRLRWWGLNVATISLVALWLFPIYWLILTSIKPTEEIDRAVPVFFFRPTLENYYDLFARFSFARVLQNSFVVTSTTTVLVIAAGVLAAYALARMHVPGGKQIALWILSLRFIPTIAVGIPFYLMWQRLNLLDTYPGLILVYIAFNLPFAIWLMRGFLVDLPPDLDEAAMLDGLSRLQIIRRIIVPVASPGIAATAIFTFVFTWNEYLMALLLTSVRATTVPVTVSKFIMAYAILWGDVSAAAVIELVPMLFVVFLLQRHIVRGITLGAVK